MVVHVSSLVSYKFSDPYLHKPSHNNPHIRSGIVFVTLSFVSLCFCCTSPEQTLDRTFPSDSALASDLSQRWFQTPARRRQRKRRRLQLPREVAKQQQLQPRLKQRQCLLIRKMEALISCQMELELFRFQIGLAPASSAPILFPEIFAYVLYIHILL